MKNQVIIEKNLKEFLKSNELLEDFIKNIKYGGRKQFSTISEAFLFSEVEYPKRIKNKERFWRDWSDRFLKEKFNL